MRRGSRGLCVEGNGGCIGGMGRHGAGGAGIMRAAMGGAGM